MSGAGELVDVGGYRLAISRVGLGEPPVVFVSWLGGTGDYWRGVNPHVTTPAMLVAYDRAGLGASDPLPGEIAKVPRPPAWVAAQLHTLLDHAGVPSPRVLVGHSIGGPVIEAYADGRPDDTAGLVFVDTTDATFRWKNEPDGHLSVDGDDDGGGVRFDLDAEAAALRDGRILPRVPVVVLTCAIGRWLRITDRPDLLAKMAPMTLAEMDDRWQLGQRQLAERTRGRQVIAHEAGHDLVGEAPALVAAAVDAVVTAVRDGRVEAELDAELLAAAGGRLVARDQPGVRARSPRPGTSPPRPRRSQPQP